MVPLQERLYLSFSGLSGIYCLPRFFFSKYKKPSLRLASKVFDNPTFLVFFLFLFTIVLQVFFLKVVNKGFCLSGDENAYLFQAKIFSKFSLTVPSHLLKEFFNNDHIVNNGRMFSIYPPGLPFLLMGISWLVGPFFAASSLLVLYKIFQHDFPSDLSFFAVVSIALSRFFISFGASYHSHSPTFFFIALTMLLYLRLETSESPSKSKRLSLGLGAAFGAAFIIRPFSAAIFAVYLMYGFLRNWPRKGINNVRAKFILMGFLPFLLIFFAYNHHLTGNIFKMAYLVSDDAQFVGLQTNLLAGIKNIIYSCWRLFDGLFPLPASVSLFFLFLGVWKSEKKARNYFYLFLFALLVCSLMPFHQFRYLYSFSFFMHIYIFIGFTAFLDKILILSIEDKKICFQWLISIIIASGTMVLCNDINVKGRWLKKITTPYRVVEKAGIKNAVIFLKDTKEVYPMFYTRNAPDFNDSVLYALDRGDKNQELMEFYKGRSFFVYSKGTVTEILSARIG